MAGVNRPLSRRYGPWANYVHPISLIAVEAPTLAIIAETYPVSVNERNTIEATLPALQARLDITRQVAPGFEATLPALQAEAFFGGQIGVTLPALQAALSATVLPVLRFDVALPALQAAFSATTGAMLRFDAALPALTATATFGGDIEATLPALQATFSATTGTLLNFDVTLPALTATVGIASEAHMRIDATLPALQSISPLHVNITLPSLTAHVVMSEVVVVTYEAYAINLATGAVTHYTNYPFDNILRFGDKYYGVKADGLFEIGGSLDIATQIDAHIKTFQTDFGYKNFKRVPSVYASGRSDGGVVVGVTADEGPTHEYESDWGEVPETTNHRSIVGRGLRGVYYSLSVKNVGGGSLDLDALSVQTAPTKRAI